MYPQRPRVTITHKESGISAYCSECRTDRENYEKALKLLRSRLWAAQQLAISASEITVEFYDGTEMEKNT